MYDSASQLSFEVDAAEHDGGTRVSVASSDGRRHSYRIPGGSHSDYLLFFGELFPKLKDERFTLTHFHAVFLVQFKPAGGFDELPFKLKHCRRCVPSLLFIDSERDEFA